MGFGIRVHKCFYAYARYREGKMQKCRKIQNAEIQKYTVEIKMEIRNRKMKS